MEIKERSNAVLKSMNNELDKIEKTRRNIKKAVSEAIDEYLNELASPFEKGKEVSYAVYTAADQLLHLEKIACMDEVASILIEKEAKKRGVKYFQCELPYIRNKIYMESMVFDFFVSEENLPKLKKIEKEAAALLEKKIKKYEKLAFHDIEGKENVVRELFISLNYMGNEFSKLNMEHNYQNTWGDAYELSRDRIKHEFGIKVLKDPRKGIGEFAANKIDPKAIDKLSKMMDQIVVPKINDSMVLIKRKLPEILTKSIKSATE